jgi:hypothetical protein
MLFGRVLRTGLSSLRDRAAARLAASRFNPSRVNRPDPRTQFVWWFPEWCGLGFSRWEGHPLQWLYRWSILCGFFELRRWRPWTEALEVFRAQP